MDHVIRKYLIIICTGISLSTGVPVEGELQIPVEQVNSQEESSVPIEENLGFPVYPNATFLRSYDASMGQRYFLFGSNTDFSDMVQYYQVVLDERGRQVFDAPATHMFEIGRFREEDMAFPPGVTIKDYTWNNSEGYLHLSEEVKVERFRTIIQIVPAPQAVTTSER